MTKTLEESGRHAFPSDRTGGMTLRDYFAAKAMAGLMNVYWDTVDKYKSGDELVKCQCETAYEYADAMLAEREK